MQFDSWWLDLLLLSILDLISVHFPIYIIGSWKNDQNIINNSGLKSK